MTMHLTTHTATQPGLVLGVVVDTEDPDGRGQVRVSYPFLGNEARSAWAPIAAPMAGHDRGCWFVPEVGDEAVLGFDRDDPSSPIVLGFLWNGIDDPPSTSTKERMIRSVNQHTIRFLDPTSADGNDGGIAIEDSSGNSIVMSNGKIVLHAVGQLEIDAAAIVLTSLGNRRVVTPNSNPI
ncbi:phage baseplate assembly protein V [Nocardia jinanensis]|uniref:Gp5/Type VI secretion system Vgr protein OB-fold domain-containing protein n=1 Tax=Nocardia jinanensis TaxID=382504 RepID=A0A917RN10_9NOCA|nr:phage baseplate assembly protein V [Nocardia jinanensis]GGL14674.1 hypothetical protein GCM10011588_31490 [Nocardia jinanensis]